MISDQQIGHLLVVICVFFCVEKGL